MRIAHIAPFYAPVIGGVKEVVKRVAEYTASKGHETYVITYNRLRNSGLGLLTREEEINGVHVIRLKPDLTWSHGTYSSELPQAVKSLKPDVVHVHAWRHPHVREYTMPEVLAMLEGAGLRPVESYYSAVNDLTFVDAEPEERKRLGSYADLLKLAIRKPTRLNLLRAAAYPLVKLVPSLRMLIVAVSQKHREPAPTAIERWG